MIVFSGRAWIEFIRFASICLRFTFSHPVHCVQSMNTIPGGIYAPTHRWSIKARVHVSVCVWACALCANMFWMEGAQFEYNRWRCTDFGVAFMIQFVFTIFKSNDFNITLLKDFFVNCRETNELLKWFRNQGKHALSSPIVFKFCTRILEHVHTQSTRLHTHIHVNGLMMYWMNVLNLACISNFTVTGNTGEHYYFTYFTGNT